MAGKHHYAVLRNAFSRDSLIDRGKQNGVQWDEDSHEGVNWMRFSRALTRHLDEDKPFYTDDIDTDTLKQMHHHYSNLRALHIKTMIPHVRDGLKYLQDQDESSTHKHYTEYLPQVYQHLSENGGHHWADKARTLHQMNKRINEISNRLQAQGIQLEDDPTNKS